MSNDTQTLLANDSVLRTSARQSTKDEQAARRKKQRERLQVFWGDCYDLLAGFAHDCIPDYYAADGGSDCETALLSVRKKLYRCKAQTREGFIAWAVRQLAKEPHFHLVADAVSRFDLGLSNLIDAVSLKQSRYADFPEHYKDGGLYRVNMGTAQEPIAWTIPEQFWEYVQKLWPVYLKKKADGTFFIAKKIKNVVIPVHRLILPVTTGDTVCSSSGNCLDWTSLYVRPFNRSGLYEGRRMGWNKEANRPNTISEEFNARMRPLSAVETDDEDERAPGPTYSTPANANLSAKTTCWGKVVSTGWVNPITPTERDQQDATERYTPPVKQSARMLAAAQALDRLGV